VNANDKKISQDILSTFCKVMVNVPESEINKVTALSGSGPAYVFYFAEAMLEAASRMGFDLKDAKSLVAQTFRGSAELLDKSDDTPAVLRQNVTSKGGTTEKALGVMDAAGLKEIFVKAVISAKERADELGK
jgi:pyrroline-5-carboxylate reductase